MSLSGLIALFNGAGMVTKLITLAVLAVTLLGAYGMWHHKVYQSGVDATIAKIARADAKTIERASKARAQLKDCKSRGLKWDQVTGSCA